MRSLNSEFPSREGRSVVPFSKREGVDHMGRMMFSLTPAESKRLIAKGIVKLPEVQNALEHGKLVVAGGTTNAYIAEELLGRTIDKGHYTAGIVVEGTAGETTPQMRVKPVVFEDGKESDRTWQDVIKEFRGQDVFIKGANAIDVFGHAGILVGSRAGGTIGGVYAILLSRGCHLILPVGLEKLIPSVEDASRHLGQDTLDICMGEKCGLFPVVTGKVFTEVEALAMLFSVDAYHVASGGVGGSEGSVTLVVEGELSTLKDIQAFLEKEIKGEPAITL
jgi:hypothetical protein